jgi:hypothetical protein
VFLNEVDPAAYRQLAQDDFRDAVPEAMHVQVEPDFMNAAMAVQGGAEIRTLVEEWDSYVEVQDLAGLDRPRVLSAGRRFLEDAQAEPG